MLSVHNAYKLSEMLSDAAPFAYGYAPNVDADGRGGIVVPQFSVPKMWGVKVESYDGYVAVRFRPPDPGPIRTVPMPPDMAIHMAGLLRFKAQQAAYKMRFEFRNGGGAPERQQPRPKRHTLKELQTERTLDRLRRKLIY